MREKLTSLLFFLLLSPGILSQVNPKKLEFRGYISHMPSVMFQDIQEEWISDNLIHNRLNLFLYPSPSLSMSIQMRNRFFYGQSLTVFPGYAERFSSRNNWMDLSWNILEEKSFLFNLMLDRAWVRYNKGDFTITTGRQRINWGQGYVWNPNDIFNVQNFFDFDYMEKPGSDAIRIQYYPNYTSTAEIAASLDHKGKVTTAGYYRFNKLGYDFQFLGGVFTESDFVAGLGWAGDIRGAGFRGEATWLWPIEEPDSGRIFHAMVSADYTFRNSLYLQFEGLYTYESVPSDAAGFFDYYLEALSIKRLSFSEWNFFAQLSYPVTPIFNLSLSGMYFPEISGFYTGPDLKYSLKDNADLNLILQIFSGNFPDPATGATSKSDLFLGFIRYRINF